MLQAAAGECITQMFIILRLAGTRRPMAEAVIQGRWSVAPLPGIMQPTGVAHIRALYLRAYYQPTQHRMVAEAIRGNWRAVLSLATGPRISAGAVTEARQTILYSGETEPRMGVEHILAH